MNNTLDYGELCYAAALFLSTVMFLGIVVVYILIKQNSDPKKEIVDDEIL